MRTAYKMFNADLTCTMGNGTFQYEPGKWFEEPEANCVKNGFHCAANPLDCLNYYSWDRSQCWIVVVDGDIDEDGTDTKISATRIKLVRRLDLKEFLMHALSFVVSHPNLKDSNQVVRGSAKAAENDRFVIVRGKDPVAAGVKVGQYIGILVEELESNTIAAAGLYQVDGTKIKPGVYYDVDGMEREC